MYRIFVTLKNSNKIFVPYYRMSLSPLGILHFLNVLRTFVFLFFVLKLEIFINVSVFMIIIINCMPVYFYVHSAVK